MIETDDELLELAYQSERHGDRIKAIRLYRQVADGESEHSRYAGNCAEYLEELGAAEPVFLIGGGSYDNLMTYRLVANDQCVRLEPLGMPWSMMVVMNLLFLVFFAGFLNLATLRKNSWWGCGIIVVIALATCCLFDICVYIRYRNSIRRGPILTYDKAMGLISLPDRGIEFSISDNVSIECLTAREEGCNSDDCCSELNFVVSNGGNVDRFNLLRSIATLRPFGKLTKQLRQELPIPVRRL